MVVDTMALSVPTSVEELQTALEEIGKEVEKDIRIGKLVSPRDIQEALRKSTLDLVLRIRGDGDLPKEAAETITTWRRQVEARLIEGVVP